MASDEQKPPPYEEIDSTVSTSLTETCDEHNTISIDSEIIRSYADRIQQINRRLKEMGYDALEHPMNCPDYLMGYEESKRSWRAPFVDAGIYVKRLDKFLSEYKRTECVLTSKIRELEEKKIGTDDSMDFTWKEERDGVIYKSNIRSYYGSHQIALDNLVKFVESATPVDGTKIFNEKNRLVAEKVDLLVKMRGLQLNALSGISFNE
jgi:hypothetical protein